MGPRLLLIIALLSIIAFVTIPALLDLRPEDPAIDDSDLRIVRAELAEESNEVLRLSELGARLSWPEDGDDTVKELLEAESIDVQRATAFLDLELARRVRTARGTDLATGAIGLAAAVPALDAMPEIVSRATLDPPTTLATTRRWSRARSTQKTWRAIWQGEYETMARTTDEIAAGAAAAPGEVISEFAEELPTNTYYFQPNATKALYADYYRALQAGTGVPCNALDLPDVEMPRQPLMFLGIFAGANAVGEILFSVAAIDVRRYERRRCDHDTKLAVGCALLALHAHHRNHGTWPDSLDALVPEFLDAVPLDGSNGRPLYYDPERVALATIQAVDGEIQRWNPAN